MDLTYVMEYRFRRSPCGAIWTDTSYDYQHWLRYLEIFDKVRIVARVCEGAVPTQWRRVDGPAVEVAEAPYFIGTWQYGARALSVRSRIRAALREESAVILRVPSTLAMPASAYLIRNSRPFAVEVVGDPYDVLSPGISRHPAASLLRWYYTAGLKKQCLNATAACYVASCLAKRYPTNSGAWSMTCSDVMLDDSAFVEQPRMRDEHAPATLVTVATLSQMYKGIDILLRAMAQCRDQGLNLDLRIVGDGQYRGNLETLAASLSLKDRVVFCGALPAGHKVREQLDAADLFVLPSYTEGMPRALLEAMARGLPCIASRVGGVPEVLDAQDLVSAGNPEALAINIRSAFASPERMNSMARRNLETARLSGLSEIDIRWRRFLSELRTRTASHSSGSFGEIPQSELSSQL